MIFCHGMNVMVNFLKPGYMRKMCYSASDTRHTREKDPCSPNGNGTYDLQVR